jgi:hypothetical protein
MYGKLVNGELVPAPKNFRGIINYNLYPARMVEDGYKPVVYTQIPADGVDEIDENTLEVLKKAEKKYKSTFKENSRAITQVWVEDVEDSV